VPCLSLTAQLGQFSPSTYTSIAKNIPAVINTIAAIIAICWSRSGIFPSNPINITEMAIIKTPAAPQFDSLTNTLKRSSVARVDFLR